MMSIINIILISWSTIVITAAAATVIVGVVINGQIWYQKVARKTIQTLEELQLRKPPPSFPFLKLPPEIRMQIYTEAIQTSVDDLRESSVEYTSNSMVRLMRLTTDILARDNIPAAFTALIWGGPPGDKKSAKPSPRGRDTDLYSLLTTSKLLNPEVTEAFCRDQTVALTLDTVSDTKNETLISAPSLLIHHIRRLHLTIVITPEMMLPNFPNTLICATHTDLHNKPNPATWEHRHPILSRLSAMTKLRQVEIIVKASGNSVANPVLLWNYVVCSLLGTSMSWDPRSPPPLTKLGGRVLGAPAPGIRFRFQVASQTKFMPNSMVLMDAEGEDKGKDKRRWVWFCREGHEVMPHAMGNDARKFAVSLVSSCGLEDCPASKDDD